MAFPTLTQQLVHGGLVVPPPRPRGKGVKEGDYVPPRAGEVKARTQKVSRVIRPERHPGRRRPRLAPRGSGEADGARGGGRARRHIRARLGSRVGTPHHVRGGEEHIDAARERCAHGRQSAPRERRKDGASVVRQAPCGRLLVGEGGADNRHLPEHPPHVRRGRGVKGNDEEAAVTADVAEVGREISEQGPARLIDGVHDDHRISAHARLGDRVNGGKKGVARRTHGGHVGRESGGGVPPAAAPSAVVLVAPPAGRVAQSGVAVGAMTVGRPPRRPPSPPPSSRSACRRQPRRRPPRTSTPTRNPMETNAATATAAAAVTPTATPARRGMGGDGGVAATAAAATAAGGASSAARMAAAAAAADDASPSHRLTAATLGHRGTPIHRPPAALADPCERDRGG